MDPYSRELPKYAIFAVHDTRDGPELVIWSSFDTEEQLRSYWGRIIKGNSDNYIPAKIEVLEKES
jgi:hypothetical protein